MPLPSTGTRNMRVKSLKLARSLITIKCVPSGVQPMTYSPEGWKVTCRATPPSAGMMYVLSLPATCAVNAMLAPLGEKEGPERTFAVEVRRVAAPPSRGTVQMSSA